MTPEEQLQQLADRAAIADVVNRYATGLDTRDWVLYRSVFTAEFDNYTSNSETPEHLRADDWVERWRPVFEGYDATQHLISNHVFSISGDEATCVSYLRARHVILNDGVADHYTIGGYYTNRFVRTDEGWKLCVRRLTVTWTEGDRGLTAVAEQLGRKRLGLS